MKEMFIKATDCFKEITFYYQTRMSSGLRRCLFDI